MEKKEKVSDSELIKWINILGVDRFLNLYIDDKLILTAKQLQKLLDIKNGVNAFRRTGADEEKRESKKKK